MTNTPNLQALYEELKRQDGELAKAQELLSSLDPGLGLDVDAEALSAIEEALEVTPTRSPAIVPSGGLRV